MGWCSGSDVAAQVWDAVRTLIPAGREKVVAARRIIKVVENFDCDTITEAKQLCADAGYVYDEQKDEHVYTPLPPLPERARNLEFERICREAYDRGEYETLADVIARLRAENTNTSYPQRG